MGVSRRWDADLCSSPSQLNNIVQDSLTDMISNYKNGTEDFKKTLDKMQQDVSAAAAQR